jgi:hypothetical protein
MRHHTLFIGIEKDRYGGTIDHAARVLALDALRRKAVDVFGGYSIFHGAGGYLNNSGQLVEEGMIRMDIYTALPEARVNEFAIEVGSALNQESILHDVAGAASFVQIPATATAGIRDDVIPVAATA